MSLKTVVKPKPEALALPQLIDVLEIESSPYQPRIALGDIAELAATIAKQGLLHPPIVRPIKGRHPYKYQMVAGERRWRAMEALGYAKIPAVVRELSDIDAQEIAYLENVERKSLTDWEDAQALKNYWMALEKKEKREISQNELGRRLGRSAQFFINRKELLEISDDLKAIAQKHQGVMTQLFLIDETRGELRQELISQFGDKPHERLSVLKVQQIIEARKNAQTSARQNYTAPDQQTQSRQSAHAQSGGGQMSRGHQLTRHSKSQASAEARNAVVIAQNNLRTAQQWIDAGGNVPTTELTLLQHKIQELLAKALKR